MFLRVYDHDVLKCLASVQYFLFDNLDVTYLPFSDSSDERGALKERTVVQAFSSPYVPSSHAIPFPR